MSRLAASLNIVRNQTLRLAGVALLTAASCGGDAPMRAAAPTPNGVLVVDHQTMSFETSFCVAEGATFAAVGRGRLGDDPFMITVRSPGAVTVRFGVSHEIDAPPPQARGLYRDGTMHLRADDGRITGGGTLLQLQSSAAGYRSAAVDLHC